MSFARSSPTSRGLFRICCALLLHALANVAACGGGDGGTSPPNRPLAFVGGGGASDTIDAVKQVRLTIAARDNSGAPLANELILVRVEAATPNVPFGSVLAGTLADGAVTTNAQGLASTELQLGEVAGTWHVLAFDRGYTDSVAFTVRPGAPASVTLSPRDTALFVGGRYAIVGATKDRHGNAVAATLTYSADSVAGVATTTSAGAVAGVAVGRARFLVRVGAQTLDTARVTVVPPGKLAAESDEGLVVLNMDGSSYRVLVPPGFQYMFPSWSPDGSGVVYNAPSPVTGQLHRVGLQGGITNLSTGMPSETWPRYSADGQYLFFSGGWYPDSIDTYRMRTDGTGPVVRVTPLHPGSTRYWKASPSPDGKLLAYSEAGFVLRVVSLVDGTDRIISGPAQAESPRFSPDGNWIAYANNFAYSIEIIRVDGTGLRVLTPPLMWTDDWGHDWSPDGQWIIFSSGGLHIVRVSDGLILPLPFKHVLYEPSWHQ